MPRKKQKKSSAKTIHYVQLRTHRQWTNPFNYLSHLQVYHSKIKPITYDIDTILNTKWMNILRPQFINQLNQIYQQDIRKNYLHKKNLIDYKYFVLNDQFDENNQFIREIFIRSIEITDYLLYLYQQIEYGQRQIYEYRLNILKFEFEQERQSLRHLFVDQELKQFQNQIDILNGIEQDNILQQSIQFQLEQRKLEENFFKDMNILYADFRKKIDYLTTTKNQLIRSNDPQLNVSSKQCHYLYEKVCQGKEQIDQERKSIKILKMKIEQTKKHLGHIDIDRTHINDKLNQLKQCFNNSQNKENILRHISHSNELLSKKSLIKTCLQNRSQLAFRRLSVLIDNSQKICQKKLSKAERLLLLINQCDRLEFEDEKYLLSKINSNESELTNKTLSKISYLNNCRLEFNSSFDELNFFWKKFAHIQMDLFIRIQEKISLKKTEKFYKNQLRILF